MRLTFFCLLLSLPGYAQHISESDLKNLAFMAGTWDVEADVRLGKEGPWEKSMARAVVRTAVGETILEEECVGTKQGHALVARRWLAHDNRSKLYQLGFVDSDHGVLLLYDDKLEDGVLTFTATHEVNAMPIMFRVQYALISSAAFEIENARSTDGGKTWDTTGRWKYSRAPRSGK